MRPVKCATPTKSCAKEIWLGEWYDLGSYHLGPLVRKPTGARMDVTLHFGAHRCATTSFQHFVRHNAEVLERCGIGFWGPQRTRGGEIGDVLYSESSGKIRLQHSLDECRQNGVRHLLISDENMLGSVIGNLRHETLYPEVSRRAQRLSHAFAGQVTQIVLNIRALSTYWVSAAAYLRHHKGKSISADRWEKISLGKRSWRDVIIDLANAFPNVRLRILPFEDFANDPAAQFQQITGASDSTTPPETRKNQTRFQPETVLSPVQAARLWDAYTEDLAWLDADANGMAELIRNPNNTTGGEIPAQTGFDKRTMQ